MPCSACPDPHIRIFEADFRIAPYTGCPRRDSTLTVARKTVALLATAVEQQEHRKTGPQVRINIRQSVSTAYFLAQQSRNQMPRAEGRRLNEHNPQSDSSIAIVVRCRQPGKM
jgi:hypothetical protein